MTSFRRAVENQPVAELIRATKAFLKALDNDTKPDDLTGTMERLYLALAAIEVEEALLPEEQVALPEAERRTRQRRNKGGWKMGLCRGCKERKPLRRNGYCAGCKGVPSQGV